MRRVTRGSPNVVGAVALAAACAVLQERRDDRARYEHTAERLAPRPEQIPGAHTHSLFGAGPTGSAWVAFTIDGLDLLVSTALSVEHGIGVRDGKFCAHPLVDALLADGDEGTFTTAVRQLWPGLPVPSTSSGSFLRSPSSRPPARA
ncbi:MAG: aminotransferase class V-fold PLP-dependent enzyme [Actinomycetales bacterium]|uniref:Aminotransferase class V-fold PLP-dependent enzyme n=1 Tax=Candidatus Phosphoribacter hodrii TaxID=2953743 RepID=A0A935IYG5_9MICO|nr:aminotransferase class V-fold PLP-dependent enzyme [Candidatus Phosphoribacter hodrii]